MRLLITSWMAVLVLALSAGTASAYTMTMVNDVNPGQPTGNMVVGELITLNIFLDTGGLSSITLISVGLTFDGSPDGITNDGTFFYRTDLSDAEDYYPLYAPGVPNGKVLDPPTYLQPTQDPPGVFIAQSNLINTDFTEVNLGQTTATATNLLLATITLQTTAPGSHNLAFNFNALSNTFNAGGMEIKNDGNVFAVGSITITVPEPGLAGASLAALGTLGALYTRRRRS